MGRLARRDRWPLLAMQSGAVAAAIGMIGGQLAQAATVGQVVFTTVFAVLFVAAIWLLAKGNAQRLRQAGSARVPEKEPLKLVLVGVAITAIVMWLTAAYGIFIAHDHPWRQRLACPRLRRGRALRVRGDGDAAAGQG